MQYLRFGCSGIKVSRLCMGCMSYGSPQWREWVLGEDAARSHIKAALDAGINFFDTANVYSLGESERVVGQALRDLARRNEIVLATKVGNPMGEQPNQRGLSRKHILESIDASLKRLGTDYVDLYIVHRFDYGTPVEETIAALNEVVRAGKALYLGASSMYAWQFEKMLTLQRERGLAAFVSMQNYYNLLYREEEREMLPLCRAEGIAVTPWSPLARGFLAGNMPRAGEHTLRARTDLLGRKMGIGDSDLDHEIAGRVRTVAEKLGAPPAAVALAWVLAHPAVTAPVIGTTKPHHLPAALQALELKLDGESKAYLEESYRPRAVSGHQ